MTDQGRIAVLVRAAADGNDEAWEQLVDHFAGLVWAVARGHGLSAADAADVSQSTWLRLAENVASIRQPERVGAWLATTARNESIRVIRRGRRDIPVPAVNDLPMSDEASDVSRRLLDDERDKSLVQAFAALPPRCKTLLRILTATPPPSYAEASEMLEMPIGSIGPTRARCLEHLRRCSAVDTADVRQDAHEARVTR